MYPSIVSKRRACYNDKKIFSIVTHLDIYIAIRNGCVGKFLTIIEKMYYKDTMLWDDSYEVILEGGESGGNHQKKILKQSEMMKLSFKQMRWPSTIRFLKKKV